jgi:hypothetical protein
MKKNTISKDIAIATSLVKGTYNPTKLAKRLNLPVGGVTSKASVARKIFKGELVTQAYALQMAFVATAFLDLGLVKEGV